MVLTIEGLLDFSGDELKAYVQRRLHADEYGDEVLDPPLARKHDIVLEGPTEFILDTTNKALRLGKEKFTKTLCSVVTSLLGELAVKDKNYFQNTVEQEYLRRLAVVAGDAECAGTIQPVKELLKLGVLGGNRGFYQSETEMQLVYALMVIQKQKGDFSVFENYWNEETTQFHGPAFLGMLYTLAEQTLRRYLPIALRRGRDTNSYFSAQNTLTSYVQVREFL